MGSNLCVSCLTSDMTNKNNLILTALGMVQYSHLSYFEYPDINKQITRTAAECIATNVTYYIFNMGQCDLMLINSWGKDSNSSNKKQSGRI